MSNRLDKDREASLQPERMEYAKEQLQLLGLTITFEDKTELRFDYKGRPVKLFPYSGWFSGASVGQGRGIKKLLNKLK